MTGKNISGKNLTADYRPQTFAQVLGQEGACTILSRAAAWNRVAPAYMFSGTRGVGKTTVARILAKAINCSQGPAAEPCNDCMLCRRITQGISLDVQEIDGASHTGVDHVRKLNEEVGYSPLEGRYKIIIIDEAHMLSKSAFNALLKTLEEPPAHAVFILATTEPHRFPATIVSRCQHFTFKLLSSRNLVQHMGSILEREHIHWEEKALEILARKAAGSVRDALSMLNQVLALGEKGLHAEQVRDILGIAKQQSMQDLFQAFVQQDCLAISQTVQELLQQGLDVGFFLEELASAWRNLFILKQAGQKGAEFLELPPEELQNWQALAQELPLAQIHAAWQMTLEGQRQVAISPDAGLALELLLFNIAFLPDLLNVDQAAGAAANTTGNSQQSSSGGQRSGVQYPAQDRTGSGPESQPAACAETRKGAQEQNLDWEGFLNYLKQKSYQEQLPSMHLVQAELQEDKLKLHCPVFWQERLQAKQGKKLLQQAVNEYFQSSLVLELKSVDNGSQQQEQGRSLEEKVRQEPVVQKILQEFEGDILKVSPRDKNGFGTGQQAGGQG